MHARQCWQRACPPPPFRPSFQAPTDRMAPPALKAAPHSPSAAMYVASSDDAQGPAYDQSPRPGQYAMPQHQQHSPRVAGYDAAAMAMHGNHVYAGAMPAGPSNPGMYAPQQGVMHSPNHAHGPLAGVMHSPGRAYQGAPQPGAGWLVQGY